MCAMKSLSCTGNAELKKGNIAGAGDLYSKAIELDPSNAIFYCNRYSECTRRHVVLVVIISVCKLLENARF